MDRRLAPGYSRLSGPTGCFKFGAAFVIIVIAIINLDSHLATLSENPEESKIAQKTPTPIVNDPNSMIWDNTNYVDLGVDAITMRALPDKFPQHYPKLKDMSESELIEYFKNDTTIRIHGRQLKDDFMELDGQKSLGGRHIWIQEQGIREDYLEDLYTNGVLKRIIIPRHERSHGGQGHLMAKVIIDKEKFEALDSESHAYFGKFLRHYLYVYWPHVVGNTYERNDPAILVEDTTGKWYAWVTDEDITTTPLFFPPEPERPASPWGHKDHP